MVCAFVSHAIKGWLITCHPLPWLVIDSCAVAVSPRQRCNSVVCYFDGMMNGTPPCSSVMCYIDGMHRTPPHEITPASSPLACSALCCVLPFVLLICIRHRSVSATEPEAKSNRGLQRLNLFVRPFVRGCVVISPSPQCPTRDRMPVWECK